MINKTMVTISPMLVAQGAICRGRPSDFHITNPLTHRYDASSVLA